MTNRAPYALRIKLVFISDFLRALLNRIRKLRQAE